MTFESHSSMLSIPAVTERLLARSPYFALRQNSLPLTGNGSTLEDESYKTIGDSTVLTYPQTKTRYSSTTSPRSNGTSTTLDRVAFELRPSTVPEHERPVLNQKIYSEWLKGSGVSWLSDIPHLSFNKSTSAFEITVTDSSGVSIVSDAGLNAILDSVKNIALDICVSKHLIEGGDDRLHLDSKGCNKYNCRPHPPPRSTILRSSSTCSPPTRDGFEAARNMLRKLWSEETTFEKAMSQARATISQLVGVVADHDVILHPSGSDAELIPLLAAMIEAKELQCSRIVNVVVAAGEVGSGTAPASGGRHFSAYAPLGATVENNAVLNDFPLNTEVVELKPRAGDGAVIQEYDALVDQVVEERESSSSTAGRAFYVLHAVDGSKTGLRLPSRSILQNLRERLGERCLIVLDACQCRSEPQEYEFFLRNGACVLVTSSKFYSAPGFCGAVLVPRGLADKFDGVQGVPKGLCQYLTRYEVPHSMRGLRRSLPEGPANYGLLLRWACGIAEMKMFASLGSRVRAAMRDWVRGVKQLVKTKEPLLELIEDASIYDENDNRSRLGGCNSIISIRFLTSCGSSHIDCDTLKVMYKHLTNDASSALPSYASQKERDAASICCLVGQPVKLGTFGVLRLSVGAPLARDIAQPGGLEKALIDDAKILEKMIVLAKYCDELS